MRGTRWFAGGAAAFVIGGAAHAFAHLQPVPDDAATKELVRVMTDYRQSMAGIAFSARDVFDCLSWYMVVLSVLVGVVGLLLLRAFASTAWRQRLASFLHAVGAGCLCGVAARFGIAPPAVVYGAAAVLFGVALVRTRA